MEEAISGGRMDGSMKGSIVMIERRDMGYWSERMGGSMRDFDKGDRWRERGE